MLAADGVATGSASRSSTWRSFGHVAVAGGAWLLLAALWFWQLNADHVPDNWERVVALVAAGGIAFAVLSAVWVRWNQSIYSRRHRRHAPIVSNVQFEFDALGRVIVADAEDRAAQSVVVRIDPTSTEKHYRAA